MSKKNKRKHSIRLEVGKFYRVIDGSVGGHPGQVYKIDKNEKVFYAVVTGSMTKEEFEKYGLRKGYIKLSKPTDNYVDISLVKKRPFVGDRNDYGEKEYSDMKFADEDILIILKVQSRRPLYGSYYKKKKRQ